MAIGTLANGAAAALPLRRAAALLLLGEECLPSQTAPPVGDVLYRGKKLKPTTTLQLSSLQYWQGNS